MSNWEVKRNEFSEKIIGLLWPEMEKKQNAYTEIACLTACLDVASQILNAQIVNTKINTNDSHKAQEIVDLFLEALESWREMIKLKGYDLALVSKDKLLEEIQKQKKEQVALYA